MKTTSKAVALAAASLFALASAIGIGCEKPAPGPTQQPSAAQPAPSDSPAHTHTYHSRGIIKSIPVVGNPASELQIQHEAINDFVGASGEVVGMNAMTMPFPNLSDGVTLDGLAVGDKIAFAFTNTWSGPASSRSPRWVIDSISKLPADTELVFEKKQTPGSAPAGD